MPLSPAQIAEGRFATDTSIKGRICTRSAGDSRLADRERRHGRYRSIAFTVRRKDRAEQVCCCCLFHRMIDCRAACWARQLSAPMGHARPASGWQAPAEGRAFAADEARSSVADVKMLVAVSGAAERRAKDGWNRWALSLSLLAVVCVVLCAGGGIGTAPLLCSPKYPIARASSRDQPRRPAAGQRGKVFLCSLHHTPFRWPHTALVTAANCWWQRATGARCIPSAVANGSPTLAPILHS